MQSTNLNHNYLIYSLSLGRKATKFVSIGTLAMVAVYVVVLIRVLLGVTVGMQGVGGREHTLGFHL